MVNVKKLTEEKHIYIMTAAIMTSCTHTLSRKTMACITVTAHSLDTHPNRVIT